MPKIVMLSDFRRRKKRESRQVCFTRAELNLLLSAYSRRVIGGEWKDYAIDHGRGFSAFSIFTNSSDRPMYTIFKFAQGTHRQGDFIVGSGGNTIKRGRTLGDILTVFDAQVKLVSS